MTSIRTLPSVPYVLPNAARTNNRPIATTGTLDFPTLLKANAKPDPSPPYPANTRTQPAQVTNMSRRLDIDAMLLQLLACRKMLFHATSRSGRSAPGVSASGVAIPDCSDADDTLDESKGVINSTCADDQNTVSCTEHVEDPTTWRADFCGNSLVYGVPVQYAPQFVPTAVALPASIVNWTPVEIARGPMRSAGARLRRRRKPQSPNSHRDDQQDADIDGHEW